MANEMPVVKVLGRSRLQGGGHNTAGIASNSKEEVWGELVGDYVTNGALFKPHHIGLLGNALGENTFDKLNLTVVSVNNGTEVTATTTIECQYSGQDGKILMTTRDINGAATAAVNTEEYVVNFHAIGDSARNPDLT
jgi:hypothetical protein